MDSTVLPCELLYLIIDAVDTSTSQGRGTLSTCSYANRALTVVCQKRIFQSVRIRYKTLMNKDILWIFRDEEITTAGHKFLDLLARSPHIGSYVQNLTITLSPSGSGKPCAFSSESPSFSLYNIIPRLLNLKGFLIPRYDHYGWSKLEERTRNFFVTIIPLVTKLDFSALSLFPVSKFSGCYNLQELHVFTLDNDVKEMISTPREKVKLRSLEIPMSAVVQRPMPSWFNTTHSPLDFSELRSLRFKPPCLFSVPHIEETLALCSNMLEDLDLVVDLCVSNSQLPSPEQTVNLGSLHNLHHLTIRTPSRDEPISIGEYQYHYHQPAARENDYLSHIVRMLKTLPFHLLRPRQVRLDLLIGVACFYEFDTDLPLVAWSDLINLLDDNRLSSYFASVKLEIEQFNNNTALAALTRILDKNEGLRKLREKGILSYELYDDYRNYC